MLISFSGLDGAGKTTLVKLACGFLDPTRGRVLLNGEDIRQYDRRDYYRLFSAVFQNFSVLEASVAENIAQQTVDQAEWYTFALSLFASLHWALLMLVLPNDAVALVCLTFFADHLL